MSALPPKADMCGAARYVRFGPIADIDIMQRRQRLPHRRRVPKRLHKAFFKLFGRFLSKAGRKRADYLCVVLVANVFKLRLQ